MGAVTKAAAALIVTALKTMKFAVCRAEACCCRQCREIRTCCLFHCGRQRAGAQGVREHPCAPFEAFEMSRSVIHSFPRVFEASRIVIANDCLFLSLRRRPAT